jgi:hypothetical protein
MVRRRWLAAMVAALMLAGATAAWADFPAYHARPNYHGIRVPGEQLPPQPPANVDCWSCHWFSTENAFNVLRVSPLVLGADLTAPAGPDEFPIVYTSWRNLVRPNTRTEANPAGSPSDRAGICQVCHTQTMYWGATYDYKAPATEEHFPDLDCRTCHPHWPTDPTLGLFDFTMLGPKSHATHLTDCKGPRLSGCTACHSSSNFTVFQDGNDIGHTTICNPCHSANGPVDGVNDPVVGAKNNWTGYADGVYDGDELKPGLEHWCDGCHDGGTSVVNGVSAPNILGDQTSGGSGTYGYNISGHGRNPTAYVKCLDCHTPACTEPGFEHCDGNARTYDRSLWPVPFNPSNYQSGFRLRAYMHIPNYGHVGATEYALCMGCHEATQLFDTGGIVETNFRNDRRHMWNTLWNNNLHYIHLIGAPDGWQTWDSDWDGNQTEGGGDSAVSCPACHNVHGTAAPKMVRHGETVVISQAGVPLSTHPNLDTKWYSDYNLVTRTGVQTTSLDESRWGTADIVAGFTSNHVCSGCHGGDSRSYFRVPHEILVPTPGSPAPAALVNGLVWTSDTSDNPLTTFSRGSRLRVHVSYYVCPYDPAPPYNVIRRLRIPDFSIGKANTANGQTEGAYYFPPPSPSTNWQFWDITVPTTAISGNHTVTVILRVNDIGGTGVPFIASQNVQIKVP